MTTPYDYIFYKIYCKDVPDIYIGLTRSFRDKKRDHKIKCNDENHKEYNLKLYKTIRENGGFDNWIMEQIEERQQVTKRQAEKIEEELRTKLIEPHLDLNERSSDLAEQLKKEKKAISDKKYRESDKGRASQAKRVDYFKEYNNTEETKQRKHQWYLDNKDKIAEQRKEKYVCDCGKEILFYKKARHQKTKFHIEYIESLN